MGQSPVGQEIVNMRLVLRKNRKYLTFLFMSSSVIIKRIKMSAEYFVHLCTLIIGRILIMS